MGCDQCGLQRLDFIENGSATTIDGTQQLSHRISHIPCSSSRVQLNLQHSFATSVQVTRRSFMQSGFVPQGVADDLDVGGQPHHPSLLETAASVSLTALPVFLGPSWYPRAKAATVLACFLQRSGGNAEVRSLKSLYDKHPDLKSALGFLGAFCHNHPSFAYHRASKDTPATVSLYGGVSSPLRCEVEAKLPLHHEAEAFADVEVYEPRWMSRKVLKSQLRRQQRQPPLGFNPRRRSERRNRQREWLHDFLQCFSPEVVDQTDTVMAATRTWPQNDRHGDGRPCNDCCERPCTQHLHGAPFTAMPAAKEQDPTLAVQCGQLRVAAPVGAVLCKTLPVCGFFPAVPQPLFETMPVVGAVEDVRSNAASQAAVCWAQHAAGAGSCPQAALEEESTDISQPIVVVAGWSNAVLEHADACPNFAFAQGWPGLAEPCCAQDKHFWPRVFLLGFVAPAIFYAVLLLTARLGWQTAMGRIISFHMACHVARLWLRMLEQIFGIGAHVAYCREWMCIVLFGLLLMHCSLLEAVCLTSSVWFLYPDGDLWHPLRKDRPSGRALHSATACSMVGKLTTSSSRGAVLPRGGMPASSSSIERCCGLRGRGCPRNAAAQPGNDGCCYHCRKPACPGFAGQPCPRANRARNNSLTPCSFCRNAMRGQPTRAAPARGLALTSPGGRKRPLNGSFLTGVSKRRRTASISNPPSAWQSGTPLHPVRMGVGGHRRLRGKQPDPNLRVGSAVQLASASAPTASLQRYRKCAVEWCEGRARTRVGSTHYCSAHWRWYATQNRKTGVGYRAGYFAGRCRLEDFDSTRVLPYAFGHRGLMRERCQHCRALYFECESSRTGFALCCRDGKLKGLPCLPPAPEPLASLLRNQSPKAEAFKQNIRRYNAALAFASFANSRGAPDGGYDGQLHGQEGRSRGPPVYILHGQAYHTISTLYPGQGRDARYGQLYIYDPEEATQLRASAFEGLDVEILRELQAMLTKPVRTEGSLLPRNPYPAHYRSLHERVCAEETEASQRGEAPRQQVLRMTCASVPDPRRYNKPSSREVAVVFVGAGALPDKFVHIYPRRTSRSPTGEDAGDLQRLSYLSEHTDPLTYPLVHVAGTLGWSTNLLYCADHLAQNAKQLRISIAEFYAHRLMTRHLPSALVAELPHASGRLFQQFAVDAYAKLENSRLDWVMRNQGKLRMDTLRGLTDHVAGLDFVPGRPHEAPPETEAAPSILRALGVVRRSSQASSGAPSPHTLQPHRPSHAQAEMKNAGLGAPPLPVLPHRRLHGKRVVLPATFGGSPRDLHQCYLDAMAIVAKFGRPDFFITMTANPNWTEVIQNLKPGEKAADRPDLVARVFRAKLRELISDLTLKGVLGKAIAYTHVVEFQKRGLPHAHILVILRAADKPRTPADVDRLVCAEVPDKAVNPRLYHLVETFMVHGPCGALDPTCPCMTELGQCSKHFPKTPRC